MSYAEELEDARRMDREHPDPEMSVGYEEAVVMSRIESETCRCPRDAEGQPSPYNVNDLCESHGGAIHRAIEDGRFWTMAWPWGEQAARA